MGIAADLPGPGTVWTKFLDRNYSSRAGVKPRIIVLHTTEGHNRPGLSDLNGLYGWFNNPAARASSHYGVDAEGNAIRMVKGTDKAWTACNYNSVSLNIEQVGFASTSRADWFRLYLPGLKRVANIMAHWVQQFDIPMKKSTQRGICGHVDLGAAGSGHHDPGPGYPFGTMLTWTKVIEWRLRGRPGGAHKVTAMARLAVVKRDIKRYRPVPDWV